MGGSGSNPNPGADQPSSSPSPSEHERRSRRQILVVEDNSADVFLIRTAIEMANIEADIHVVKDGEQAVKFFDAREADAAMPCPTLVILDINLPKKQGGEVLTHMRKGGRCRNALVIVVSTSEVLQDRVAMTKLGANGYFHKPSDYADFMKLGDMVKDLLER